MKVPRETDDKILRKVLHAILPVPEGIYPPNEDSFLMLDAISTLTVEQKEVLDMGAGSGILGLWCAMHGAIVTAADTDERALQHIRNAARKLGISLNILVSDIFSNVTGKFDVALFNPPYLPSAGYEDRTVDGGREGAVVAREFLANLGEHLKPDGVALLLLSSLNDPAPIVAEHAEFDFSVAAKRALFFEELSVLSVKFRDSAAR